LLPEVDSVKHVLYGSLNYLFKASDGEDIVGSFGGDGCSGYGSIFKVQNNSKPTEVVETGGGCNPKPTYLGSYPQKDSLVMLVIADDNHPQDLGTTTENKLYLKNALNGEESTLFDFKGTKIKSFTFNKEQNKIAFFYDNGQVFIYQLGEGKMVGPVNIDRNVKNFFTWKGDLASYLASSSIWIIETNKFDIKKYSYGNLPGGKENQVYLLGNYQNQPLIYTVQDPNY
jgi:hypothetical protein